MLFRSWGMPDEAEIRGLMVRAQTDHRVVEIDYVSRENAGDGFLKTRKIEVQEIRGDDVEAYDHLREDVQQLYGFVTEEELELFRMLISVSNVGPKMAMTVLSGIGIRELKQAIVDGAVPTLSAISGIGKKTAERVIIELREKIILDEPKSASHRKPGVDETLLEDSVQALVSLGYKKHDAKAAIQKVLAMHSHGEKLKVEELIRQSLKYV